MALHILAGISAVRRRQTTVEAFPVKIKDFTLVFVEQNVA